MAGEMTTDAQFQPLPPHSTEAEESLLASILTDPSVMNVVLPIVRAVDFYHPRHGDIYGAMVRLADRGEPTDFVMVTAELDRTHLMERIGGMDYLIRLLQGLPTSVHAEHYARTVRRAAFGRALIVAAAKICQQGYANPTDIDAAIGLAERELAEVRRQFCGSSEAVTPRPGLLPIWELYVH